MVAHRSETTDLRLVNFESGCPTSHHELLPALRSLTLIPVWNAWITAELSGRFPATLQNRGLSHLGILLLKSLRASTQACDLNRLGCFRAWATRTGEPAEGEGQCNQCLHARSAGEAGDRQCPRASSKGATLPR